MKLTTTVSTGHVRLEKGMAQRGLASRREAKDLVRKGLVRVNGVVTTEPGFGIVVGKDSIEIQGSLKIKESVLVYKPRGIETIRTNPTARDVGDQFPTVKHLFPIGRLDKETAGLLIVSNDGRLTKVLTAKDSTIGKTYHVSVRENVTDTHFATLAQGIVLDKILTKPAITKRLSRTSFSITIFEGRKHQIRRMAAHCHLTIVSLTRVGIGAIQIGKMKPGSMRVLTAQEIQSLLD